MKFNLYAMALLMGGAIAMVACTNDEPNMGNGDNTTNVPEGDVAYMNVNICNVNGGVSKALSPGYENSDGLANESKVSAAKFMFFNADGNYMNIQANKWAEGNMNGEAFDTGNNIEHFGKNTIVLRGLKGVNSYPSYMIVVLNYSDFVPGATLQETAEKIVAYSNDEDKDDDNKNEFIMSTTSYFAGGATDAYNTAYHNDKYYFATKLNDKDFQKEPATNGTSNVNVYVERVAAKVQFSAHENLKEQTFTTSSGTTFKAFPLNITIGGTDNDQSGELVEGDNKVYVKVLGWGLNATPTQSYLCKKLDTKWADTAPWADSKTYGSWQAPTDYRSFWAQSVVYGQDITEANVVYNSYSKLDTNVGGSVYTHENTNSAAKVTDEDGKLNKKAVTSILVKAEVVNGEGEGLDLIEIWGRYYTYAGFKGLVASNMATLTNKMNYYYVTNITENVPVVDAKGNQVYKQYTEDDEEGHKKGDFVLDENGEKIPLTQTVKEYKQFGVDQLEIVARNNRTGSVTVAAANLEDLSKDGQFYEKVADEYVVNEEAVDNFKKDLADVLSSYPDKITAFNGGAMYYNIPVEHLNMNNYDPETKTYTGVAEGNYGIVRNHYYKVTFSKLAKLGHGVFNPGDGSDDNPGEPIIPDEDEDDTYFLGSTINILSWKVVSQDVEL